jgi:hypothetical protein
MSEEEDQVGIMGIMNPESAKVHLPLNKLEKLTCKFEARGEAASVLYRGKCDAVSGAVATSKEAGDTPTKKEDPDPVTDATDATAPSAIIGEAGSLDAHTAQTSESPEEQPTIGTATTGPLTRAASLKKGPPLG